MFAVVASLGDGEGHRLTDVWAHIRIHAGIHVHTKHCRD